MTTISGSVSTQICRYIRSVGRSASLTPSQWPTGAKWITIEASPTTSALTSTLTQIRFPATAKALFRSSARCREITGTAAMHRA